LSNSAELTNVFRALLSRYPREFGLLLSVLVVEGFVAAIAVLALIPLTDYLLDQSLSNSHYITKWIVDSAQFCDVGPNFWLFGLLFAAANIIKSLLDVATSYTVLRIKYEIVRGLVDDTITVFFKAKWEFFARAKQGQILNTFNKELKNISDTLGGLATQLATIVQLCTFLAVPLYLNATITIIAVLLSILIGIPVLFLKNLSYRLGVQNIETGNSHIGTMSEVVGAARLILGFGRQNSARDRIVQAFDKHIAVTIPSQTLTMGIGILFQPIGYLAAIIALGIAINNGSPIAEIAAVLWSLFRALPQIGRIVSMHVSLHGFLPSYEQLDKLRKSAEKLQEDHGHAMFDSLHKSIDFKNVSFSYHGRAKTLQDINLTIKKGVMTALVGESGSGKSTITDLALGLITPQSGTVLLDGIPMSSYNKITYRERIGYVPQEPFLFDTTIRQNLLWAAPASTEADIWEACRLANAMDFVRQLPDGLDTVVGDRGIRLSGGQRQRIALARALLRKPDLLVLDEATSALDSESERLIQHSIDQMSGEVTLLVVAHRLSTIARAEQVYVLQEGRIAEHGSYEELKEKRGGIFARMVQIQNAKLAQ